MLHNEWYRDWFSSPYYEILYFRRNEEEAQRFVNHLVQYLHPAAGSCMLDVACGKGRFSKCLSRMGFDVTGIDLSEPFIKEAKQYETENLHFFLHDMRMPFRINYYDYAFNFFTSFGYFRTMREHDNAVRTIAQSLKAGGIFVIDYLNVHYTEDNLVREEEREIDGVTFDIHRWHDDDHFFKQVKITDSRDAGKKQTFTERVAKFSLGDFTDMLAYQGMQVQDVFGDYELGHYNVRKSSRMIIVAKKIHQ
ncbi:MAG TPA: class I SAM-dependent methyltransferase [Chitinophagaceae bacterium]|nr:class I SAM-dependent methyltransferase [Chitinophagaceae bacterium]